LTSAWRSDAANGMPHIERDSDLILIAPASADFLAKLAHGRADDVLSNLCLARECRLAVAPAMNQAMWAAAATRRNLEQLRRDGIDILGPASGAQACGENGPGRMLEPADLLAALPALLGAGALARQRVLVTAGPTYEAIDPVRGLSNRSSGRMGYAIAQAAADAGAEVCLVSGPTCLATPRGVRRIDVVSAAQMQQAVFDELPGVDVFIGVAAVADYRVAAVADHKLKKTGAPLTLQLEPNPDILAAVAARADAPFCVGFAAETEHLLQHAEAKRRRKQVPLLVANLAQDTLGGDDAELVLLDANGAQTLPRADKPTQARRLISHIRTMMKV
jgi:phosphopantothenoylcysteine decarboxylase/phosphopantothenate--cysteine ligase